MNEAPRRCLKRWVRSRRQRAKRLRREVAQHPVEGVDTRLFRSDCLEIRACEALFRLGRRTEAHQALDALEQKAPGYPTLFAETRLAWLAVESPKRWKAEVRALAKDKSDHSLWLLCAFGINLPEMPRLERKRRFALRLALEATNWNDDEVLWNAVVAYRDLADYETALKVTEKAIELYPTGTWRDDVEVWDKLTQKREDLANMVKSRFW